MCLDCSQSMRHILFTPLISILCDKSKMKDDWGIQDITTKYFCWNAFYSLFFLVLRRVKRLHKQENKPLCFHNVRVQNQKLSSDWDWDCGWDWDCPQFCVILPKGVHYWIRSTRQTCAAILKIVCGNFLKPVGGKLWKINIIGCWLFHINYYWIE